ncbi:MAG: hypothetical protein QXM89_01745 [Candidatus Bathyarchaeia archaeon]
MRRVESYVLLTVVIILMFTPSVRPTDTITYERKITLYSTGYILLEDRIAGFTEKPLTLRFPRNITDNLLDYRAETADGLNLNVEIFRLTENETIIEIADYASSSLKLFLLINGSALIEQREPFTIYLPVYPGLNADIARLNFTLTVPETTEFKNYPSDFNKSAGKIWLIRENLEPDAFRVEQISITRSPLFKVEQFNKTIIISEVGDVIIEEFYRILNIGSTTSEISFNLPVNACEAKAKDEFGSLQSSVKTQGDYLKLTVKPRYELRKGDKYSLIVSYKFPAGLLTEHSLFKDSHKLSIKLEPALPVFIRILHVNLKMPRYSTIVDIKPENFTVRKNDVLSLILESRYTPILSPIRPQPILMVNYNYNVLWSSIQPVLWTLCGLVVIAIIHYTHRVRAMKTVEATSKVRPSVAIKEVQEFVSAYEEKLNLRRELRNLESDYLSRNISKAEFTTRSTKIKNRIAEIDRIIENLKQNIRQAGFSDELTTIEEAETDLNICDVGLSELRNRYRTGKVSKHVYERLLSEYNKRIRNNENKIRRAIEVISSS